MRIAIVDYGMGNLLSVRNALVAVGADVSIAANGSELEDARGIVLPGVGAFGKGMEGLRERGFLPALERQVRGNGKPFLGICLGLQLLASRGTELGDHAGLGWVEGTVVRIESPGLRVPHVGWNDVAGTGPLFAGIPANSSFYFVHSYHLVTERTEVLSGSTEYGTRLAAAVSAGNIHGVQFHPEKSHKHGLELLKNFVQLVERS